MRTQQIKSLLLTHELAVEKKYLTGLIDTVNSGIEKVETNNEISPAHSYEEKNNIAIISIDGAMTKKNTWINAICGGFASYDIIDKYIEKAELNPKIDTILFTVDTPGGMVAGADEVGERIYNSKKRTIAFTPNMLASAGMWIFSNCDEVYAGEVAELGSIGVMVAYRKEDEDGEKIMLTSKRAENKNKINDDKITARINEIEDIFYSRLIRNTGLSEENLASGFNKGETISATKAKNLGFVKEITTFDKLMKSLAVMPSDNEKITKKNLKGENMEFNEENFKALVEQNKAFAANKTTIENRLNTANLNLENINAELAAKDNEIIKLKADLENKLSEQATKNESHIKEIKTRVEEAYKCNVDKDTAIAMIECKDSNEASKLAIAAMSDTENATANEGENVSNKEKEKELAIAIAKNMKF